MPIIISVDLGTTKITSLAMDAVSGEVLAVATEVSEANVTRIEDRPRGRSEWNARRIVEQIGGGDRTPQGEGPVQRPVEAPAGPAAPR